MIGTSSIDQREGKDEPGWDEIIRRLKLGEGDEKSVKMDIE